MTRFTLRRRTPRGQGLLEYGLIIVFVVLAVVGALVLLGPAISSIFQQVPSSL
jgi:Flp pilus assembly pilin Flp